MSEGGVWRGCDSMYRFGLVSLSFSSVFPVLVCLCSLASLLVVQSFYEKRLNKLQQKQTQLILYPQYVLSKEKNNNRRIPLGESFEKDPDIAYSYAY